MRELPAVGDVVGATLSDVCTRAHARSTRTTLQNSRPPTSPTARLSLEMISESGRLVCDRGVQKCSVPLPAWGLHQCPAGGRRSRGRSRLFEAAPALYRTQPSRSSAPFSVHLRAGECRESM